MPLICSAEGNADPPVILNMNPHFIRVGLARCRLDRHSFAAGFSNTPESTSVPVELNCFDLSIGLIIISLHHRVVRVVRVLFGFKFSHLCRHG